MKFLRILWRRWLPIAHVIGNFQAQVILTAFYAIIFLPLGVVFRIFPDPLRLKYSRVKERRSNFQKWEHPKDNLETAHRQF